MTTELDHGSAVGPSRLHCPISDSGIHTTLVLALRDMRTACGRDETTGERPGNGSWIGLALSMIVIDTLSGKGDVRARWTRLLTRYEISHDDASIIYRTRCSLLHGYGPPKKVNGRKVLLIADHDTFALDTSHAGEARLSVPVFCGHLVERLAVKAERDWDATLIDTNFNFH